MPKSRGGWSAEQDEPAGNRIHTGQQGPVQGMPAPGGRTIAGEARNIERTTEQGGLNYQRTFQVLTFRVERRSPDGDLRQSVTVRLRGQRIVGNVREGELVEIGRRPRRRTGVIHVRSFRNLATGTVVAATGLFIGRSGVLGVVALLVLGGGGWYGWTHLHPRPGPPSPPVSTSAHSTQAVAVTSSNAPPPPPPSSPTPSPTVDTSPPASGSATATDTGTGGGTFTVPYVVGDTVSEAKQVLLAAGLTPQFDFRAAPAGTDATPGTVFDQDPGKDSQVSTGELVTVDVAEQPTSPPTSPTPTFPIVTLSTIAPPPTAVATG